MDLARASSSQPSDVGYIFGHGDGVRGTHFRLTRFNERAGSLIKCTSRKACNFNPGGSLVSMIKKREHGCPCAKLQHLAEQEFAGSRCVERIKLTQDGEQLPSEPRLLGPDECRRKLVDHVQTNDGSEASGQ